MSTFSDISDRKHPPEGHRGRVRAGLRQLMDGVPVGIFVVDADGSPYLRQPCSAKRLFGREPVTNLSTNAMFRKRRRLNSRLHATRPLEGSRRAKSVSGQ